MDGKQWDHNVWQTLKAGKILEDQYHLALALGDGEPQNHKLAGLYIPLTKLLNQAQNLLQNEPEGGSDLLHLQLGAKYDFWAMYVQTSAHTAYANKKVDDMGWWNGFFTELENQTMKVGNIVDDKLEEAADIPLSKILLIGLGVLIVLKFSDK